MKLKTIEGGTINHSEILAKKNNVRVNLFKEHLGIDANDREKDESLGRYFGVNEPGDDKLLAYLKENPMSHHFTDSTDAEREVFYSDYSMVKAELMQKYGEIFVGDEYLHIPAIKEPHLRDSIAQLRLCALIFAHEYGPEDTLALMVELCRTGLLAVVVQNQGKIPHALWLKLPNEIKERLNSLRQMESNTDEAQTDQIAGEMEQKVLEVVKGKYQVEAGHVHPAFAKKRNENFEQTMRTENRLLSVILESERKADEEVKAFVNDPEFDPKLTMIMDKILMLENESVEDLYQWRRR